MKGFLDGACRKNQKNIAKFLQSSQFVKELRENLWYDKGQ